MNAKKKPYQSVVNPHLKGRAFRVKKPTTDQLYKQLLAGDMPSLAQAITLIESQHPADQKQAALLIDRCLPHTGNAKRMGITGVPGVGKSSFIEAFGSLLTAEGHRVAVLAVDPSSAVSHGSILGDKTRMERLGQDPKAFIRPSASGEALGGVARKTREAMMLCEAAGFSIILVETVGVGQSETLVHSMVDFFVLLKLAGAGDELQGIKRGIVEMADLIVINKADGANIIAAKQARSAFAKALQLYPPKANQWTPKVRLCSALEETGIEEIWTETQQYFKRVERSQYLNQQRANQNKYWLQQTIEATLKRRFYERPAVKSKLPELLEAVAKNTISPFQAAQELLDSPED